MDTEAKEVESKWGPGGTYRQVATALSAAAGGNVTGSTAQFGQALVVNYVQQQGAQWVGDLVRNGDLTEGSPEHAALHAIIACAGGAASGGGCGSAAMGAETSSLLTNLFADNPNATAEEKEAKRNLIATITGGIAEAGGLNTAGAVNSAIAAADNNYLTQKQIDTFKLELNQCAAAGNPDACVKQVKDKYTAISLENDRKLKEVCASTPSSAACQSGVREGLNYAGDDENFEGQYLPGRLPIPPSEVMSDDINRSRGEVLGVVMGNRQAYAAINDIEARADYFGAMYDQTGAIWFKAAEDQSRTNLSGLRFGTGDLYNQTFGAGDVSAQLSGAWMCCDGCLQLEETLDVRLEPPPAAAFKTLPVE